MNTTHTKYENILRRLRQRAFDYPESMAEKFDRVLGKVKSRMLSARPSALEKRGPFSGLTRGELAMSRTCETDWS